MTRFRRFLTITTAFSLLLLPSTVSGQATPSPAAGKSKCDRYVDQLLSRMTTEEKVGQMVMAVTSNPPGGMPDEKTRQVIQDHYIGAVIIYNKKDPQFMAKYNNQLQQWASDTRLGIPLLVSADLEFGAAQQIGKGTTSFPRQMGLGATRDPEAAARAAHITAKEARAMGFQWNYAPVADVNTNPANPVIGVRSFGEDPELVAQMTAAQVKATQQAGVIASAKHFPGHGDTHTDSHLDLPTVDYDRETLEQIHLKPFQAAIEAGTDSIMTAHVVVKAIDPELPATLSRKVLTGLLREEMGYQGLIVTDAMTMDAIDERWGTQDAAAMAVKAGADVIMSTGSFQNHLDTIEGIEQGVKSGDISKERLNQSVKRILKKKCTYDLFTDRYANPSRAEVISGNPAHRKQALETARDAVTLVKNEGILPFETDTSQKTLVAGVIQTGAMADEVTKHSSGEVFTWQSETFDPTDHEIEQAVIRARQADRVIVTTYSQGSLPSGQAKLVHALQQTGKPVVAVSLGLPYDVDNYPDVPAYVSAYALDRWQTPNPTMLSAAVDVLFGEQPGGKLPVTIGNLYPYGHGLQYEE